MENVGSETSIDGLNKEARPVKLKLKAGANLQPIVAEFISDIIEGKEKWSVGKIKKRIETGEEGFYEIILQLFGTAVHNLVGEDKDKFISRVETLFHPDFKRAIWDRNHNHILTAISNLTAKYNRFPTRTELAHETELTRVTINRHLKEYFGSVEHKERQEEFVLMRERVLASAFKYATTYADMKAARVFLDATATQQGSIKIENQQNNFIQIKGVTVTQEQLSKLSPDQQLQLQEILATAQNTLQ